MKYLSKFVDLQMSAMQNTVACSRPKEILDFWFGNPSDKDYLESKPFWYGDPVSDKLVEKELKGDYELAACGKLDSWKESFEGSLALILLLDQVPRNIFRDTPQAYATDHLAIAVTKDVVEKKWDQSQPTIVRRYIYSPLNHSENIEDQSESLRLFESLHDPNHIYWARHFYEIIKEHGRFPHRDSILGRN